MSQILAMALKDLKLLARDRIGAFFIVGFPILMGVFFGLVMGQSGSGGGSGKMKIAIIDQDDTRISQLFVSSFEENDSVQVERMDDLEEARNLVRRGQRTAMLVLEPGFGETAGLFWETPPTIKVGVDPSRAAESAMLQGFIMESVGQLAGNRLSDLTEMTSFVERSRQELAEDREMPAATKFAMSAFLGSLEQLTSSIDTLQRTEPAGDGDGDSPAGRGGIQFANIESMDVTREIDPDSIAGQLSRSKSKWDISFPQAMMWGVLGCVAGFSISIARERTQGTLTRLHIAPVSQLQVLLGKALACFLTVVLVILMLTGLGMLLGMKPSSFPLLAIASLCIAFCFVGIMMVMSLLGKTEQSVSGAGWAINMVMAMLGGCMIPAMFMPGFLQKLSVISPVRWAILSLEGAIWRDFSIGEMLMPCAILIGVGVAGIVVGTAMLVSRKN